VTRGAGFADALLAGAVRGDWLRSAPRPPSAAARRLEARLARLLARVDGDAIDREDRAPASAISGLERLGVFRMSLPRAHGGLGLSRTDCHRLVARVAAKSAGLSMWVTTHSMAAALIERAAAADLRAKILPRLAAGELAALALAEEGAGTDATLIAARARPARGGWRLDGRKLWITNAPVARWLVVIARAPGGLTAFLVDARSRGASVERRCRFLGLRGMENGVLRLRGAFVPSGARLGAEGDGLRLGLAALSAGRLTVAARALGLARECRAAARAWTARRRQRGRPLAAEPAVAARLARLDALVARLDAVSARAARWADEDRDLRGESPLVKLFAASAAWEAADLALQLRGARGYETADSQRARGEEPVPAERWLRDARGLRLIEGTDDALRWAVARRGLELARAGARAPRGPGVLGARAAALAAEFRALARGRSAEIPARALELADEAARILADACARAA